MRENERKSAEASLKAQNEQLRANLLRSVSHDLRTPLTAITGNADMLLDNSANLNEEERRRLVHDMYEDATWLVGVVENLLAVTRLEE
jgi:two-component system sensor histidine kinase KdpD